MAVECCGEKRDTPYCPICGVSTGVGTPESLLKYLQGRVKGAEKYLAGSRERLAVREQEKPKDDWLIQSCKRKVKKREGELSKLEGWTKFVEAACARELEAKNRATVEQIGAKA